jgi:uncharacterized Fe-S center protein
MSDVYLIQKMIIKNLENGFKKISIDKIGKGDSVAIKLHMGEYGNLNYVRPPIAARIVEVVKDVGGKPFLFDTPTLYRAHRHTVEEYIKTAKMNGFSQDTMGCPVIISNKGVTVKTKGPMKEIEIAKDLYDADAIVVLSHAKGHEMTGFGGAIKNLGMGGVTVSGKSKVHSKNFLFSLAEAAEAVVEKFEYDKKFYVNVLLDITAKCDCYPIGNVDSGFAICDNIGILFSKDPVAIDIASIDLINKKTGKNIFLELTKIEPKKVIENAFKLGMGEKEYNLKE